MGIDGFYPWLVATYSDVITRTIEQQTDVLAIDLNGTIHSLCAQVFLYGDYAPIPPLLTDPVPIPNWQSLVDAFLDRLDEELVRIVRLLSPQQAVIICTDGIAPMAKMTTQLKRRREAIISDTGFNPGWITQGTYFMRMIDTHLESFCAKMNQTGTTTYLYSGTTQVGEGEHKCIRLLAVFGPSLVKVVYGIDSDLIVLALLSGMTNLYIYRDLSRTFVGIDRLCTHLNGQTYSFACLLTLVGNDFLPRLLPLDDTFTKMVRAVAMSRRRLNDPRELVRTLEEHEKDVRIVLLTRHDVLVASEYVKGITWVMDYYTNKPTLDWQWVYDFPHAPLYSAVKNKLDRLADETTKPTVLEMEWKAMIQDMNQQYKKQVMGIE